ncbi:MAG: cytochrome c peroxidase [Pseudomonadota bacterium]
MDSRPPRRPLPIAATLALTLALAACGGGGSDAAPAATAATTTASTTTSTTTGTATTATTDAATAAAAATAATAAANAAAAAAAAAALPNATPVSIGETLFNEKLLSVSAQQSCASCHAASNAKSSPAGVTLPFGGPALNLQGFRSAPSLMYLQANGAFRFQADGTPVGGFTWDGRADTRQLQAQLPLLDPKEMANADVAAVAAKVRALPYFATLMRLYSAPASPTDQQVFDTTTLALQTYQAGDPDFLLFNSKFDQVADGQASFTAPEARGLALFNDPQRGNCTSCHTSQPGAGNSRPLFTNFNYAALGLPRNTAILANADASFFDMGLCGPKRTDLAARTALCGQFKIPTLRNVAITPPYFHNAVMATLNDAVGFYAQRDVSPGAIYPTVAGQVVKFNDLPAALRGNPVQTPPFGLAAGAQPRINAQDVSDIVAFLNTLTDNPGAPARSATIGR